MKTNIIVNLQYAATHCWPECPIPEVAFLKNPHRHVFHITCKISVGHDDRELEIIMFKNSILSFLEKTYSGDFGTRSCEQIAKIILKFYNLDYCQVLEDNENGAEVWAD